MAKNGYSIQGLVAKVKDAVANSYSVWGTPDVYHYMYVVQRIHCVHATLFYAQSIPGIPLQHNFL